MCVYVSVFTNGVCVGGEWSEAFENLNVESSDFSTITKSVEKKQNRMDRSFFYARSFGAQNVTRGSNWCNEWTVRIGYLLMEHWSLEAKNTGFVRIWLQKDAFRVDTFSVPPKKHKNSTNFLIKTNKHRTQCLDVVKVNPPKKLSRDPRRLASNSRLAVSLGTFCYIVYIFYSRWWRERFGWVGNASVPRILRFWNYKRWL